MPRDRDDKKKGTSVRLTGLFQSKNKRGLYVGTARPEEVKGLIGVIKKAVADDKGITFFLWRNDPDRNENGPPFSLSADLAMDRPRGGGKRRPIEDDDDDFDTNKEPKGKSDLPW